MRAVFFFLVVIIYGPLHSQTVHFEDYYPLEKGKATVYYVTRLTVTGSEKYEDDTNVCKSVKIKGRQIFYFDDRTDEETEIIGSQSFCDGAFYYDKGVFMFSPIFWLEDLKKANLDYFEPLFPADITIDSVYKYQYDQQKRKYKFNGFEKVIIKEKVYDDCLKLTVFQDWPTAHYEDTVWFQKGIGVVKWLRSTGRLEEIKSESQ